MKKEKIKTIAIVATVVLLLSVLIGVMLPRIEDISFTSTYTLRGFLYETEDLGNNSYHFFMNDTSHKCWGNSWTFPYQEGKMRFYFSDVRDFSIEDFVDRDIDITYISDGIESEITSIGYTYYDSILQAEKETEKQLAFDEWMQENHADIIGEYDEYLENITKGS